ncbi:hypothetical protein FOZ60_015932 [Perkinsus olseni]|uniref:Ribose 5-phosphate isomerase n=2 Tax=Perkinsus olseni TaxID=32597 RepID=A0A7J6P510_PEROL|nr:hypothetical protein FOZ60_015932 [Perkinsus olseni]
MKGLEGAGALLETEWPLLSLLSTVHRTILQDRTEGDCPFEFQGPISAAVERMTEVGAVLPIPYIARHLVSLESRRDCRILRATLTVHYHRAKRLLETSLLEDIFRYSHIRAEDQEAFIEDALGPSWKAVDHVPQLQSAQSIITEFVTHNFTVTLSSRAPLLEALDLLTLHPRVTIEARSPSTEEPVHYTQMVFPHRAGSDGLISNRVRAEQLPYCTRPFIDLFAAMKLTSVIEVGPHLGDCVLWAVAVTGAIGMAAEPLKQLAEMIRASRDTNGFNSSSLTVFEVAVSDKDGPVVGGAEEPIEYIWGRAVVKTIDSLVESSETWRRMLLEGRAAGALKIHTNGGEDAVLRGALQTLSHTDGIKLIMVNTNSFKVLSSCYDVILSLPRAYDLFTTGHHGALIPLAAPTEHKLLFEPATARLQNGLKLVFGSDHAGIDLKNEMIDFVKNTLKAPEDCITDVGTFTHESIDYPDFAEKACKTLLSISDDTTKALGVVMCGSGLGISMSANKCKGIRCALCSSNYDARYSRLHNNANVLAMGGRTTGVEVAREILATYINTDFEGGRHQRRIDKMMALENKN